MADLAIPNFSIRGRTQSLFFVRIYAPAGHMTLGGGLDGILGPNSVSDSFPPYSRLIDLDNGLRRLSIMGLDSVYSDSFYFSYILIQLFCRRIP